MNLCCYCSYIVYISQFTAVYWFHIHSHSCFFNAHMTMLYILDTTAHCNHIIWQTWTHQNSEDNGKDGTRSKWGPSWTFVFSFCNYLTFWLNWVLEQANHISFKSLRLERNMIPNLSGSRTEKKVPSPHFKIMSLRWTGALTAAPERTCQRRKTTVLHFKVMSRSKTTRPQGKSHSKINNAYGVPARGSSTHPIWYACVWSTKDTAELVCGKGRFVSWYGVAGALPWTSGMHRRSGRHDAVVGHVVRIRRMKRCLRSAERQRQRLVQARLRIHRWKWQCRRARRGLVASTSSLDLRNGEPRLTSTLSGQNNSDGPANFVKKKK